MRSKKTKNLALFAFFLAVELILLFTPLGFLRIGPLSATLMHIPVIIAAITMGWKYGCALGLVFGLCSVWSATFTLGPTSFCFSPFITVGSFSGNFSSLIIAIVPRILIAVSAYGVYTLCEKKKISSGIGIPLAAAAGSITNTALVLGLIYLFFGPSYASAVNIAYETLLGVLLGVVATNGISETIVGCIVVLMVTKALKQIMK